MIDFSCINSYIGIKISLFIVFYRSLVFEVCKLPFWLNLAYLLLKRDILVMYAWLYITTTAFESTLLIRYINNNYRFWCEISLIVTKIEVQLWTSILVTIKLISFWFCSIRIWCSYNYLFKHKVACLSLKQRFWLLPII